MISKGGRSVTMVTDTAEGALCVSALPITAEMTVLAFIDIYEQENEKKLRSGALKVIFNHYIKEIYTLFFLNIYFLAMPMAHRSSQARD